NNGMFPPGPEYFPGNNGGNPAAVYHGMAGNRVYPEYWTDPAILICPSDSRSTAGSPLQDYNFMPPVPIETDFGAQIRSIASNPDPLAREWYLPMMLSLNPSYHYVPWGTGTASQLLQAMIAQIYVLQFTQPGDFVGWRPGNGSTPWGPDFSIMHIRTLDRDIGSDLMALIDNNIQDNTPGAWTDDNGNPLPTTVRRLREGIERFFIT